MKTAMRSISRINFLKITSRSIKTVTVVGCGLMGSGIAQVSAQAGYSVNLVDLNKELLDKALSSLKGNLQRVAKKKYPENTSAQEKLVVDSLQQIKISTNVIDAVKKSDLVIEAIVENILKKHELFRSIDAVAPSSCIFASNTSSLSISEIASCTKRADRFGGIHFFNPVPMMSLVEVINTSLTSPATVEALVGFGQKVGKMPIRCSDTPGFVVNRLLVPYLCEAIRMLERGDASAADIDKAMVLGAGHPMGPLTLADYVGLDTTKFILDGWHQKFPENPSFFPIGSLDRLVAENKLGLKTGEGFFSYKNKK